VICNFLAACSSTNVTALVQIQSGGLKSNSATEFLPSCCSMPRQDHMTIAFPFPKTFPATARFGRFGPVGALGSAVIKRFLLILGALVVAVDAASFVFHGSESSTLTATSVVIALIAAFALSYRRRDAQAAVARERPAPGFPNPALVANRASASGKLAA
jgi:hypothetical protein